MGLVWDLRLFLDHPVVRRSQSVGGDIIEDCIPARPQDGITTTD